jgi:DNA primase
MDWVSFDEIKKTVTLQMAIEHYGIPLRRVNTNTLRGKCPLPSHGSETSRESFTATLTKGVGGAWACQSQSCIKSRGRVGGNVLDFVAAMERCSVRDAAIKLQLWFLVPAAGNGAGPIGKEPRANIFAGKEPEHELVSKKESDGEGESDSNKPLTFNLQNIDHSHSYLNERGLSVETAKKFGIGFFPGKGSMHDRIVIPVHNSQGELVAYAGRTIDGSEPRYKVPSGFHKSLELFNVHRVRDELSVVLVEGFFDCMKVMQAGFPCVALMGSTMSNAQAELIREYFAHVIVMLDGDDAGRGASEGIADRLRRVVFQVNMVTLDDGVQPDQLSESALRQLMDSNLVTK